MAVSGGIVEKFGAGHPKVTMTVSAAVTAGALVKMTGDRTVATCGDEETAVGIAMQTASAANDKIAVQLFGDVYTLTASGAVAAGDQLASAAAGAVKALAAAAGATAEDINDARAVVGVALEAAADTETFDAMVTR